MSISDKTRYGTAVLFIVAGLVLALGAENLIPQAIGVICALVGGGLLQNRRDTNE